MDGDPAATAPRPKPGRRTAMLVVVPIIFFVTAATIGEVLTTTWANDHPLALLGLNARNRIVLLVTNRLDAIPYYAVGAARLLAPDPFFFALGALYGDAAVRWVERRSATFGSQIRLYEDLFRKAQYPIVFLAPNNWVCLFAGAAGMPVAGFAAANVAGTFVRLYVLRAVGDVFDAPIESVLDFFADYRIPLLLLSIALVGVTLLVDRRRGATPIEALVELEHELETGEGPDYDPEG